MCPLCGVPKSYKANTAFWKPDTFLQSSKDIRGTCWDGPIGRFIRSACENDVSLSEQYAAYYLRVIIAKLTCSFSETVNRSKGLNWVGASPLFYPRTEMYCISKTLCFPFWGHYKTRHWVVTKENKPWR
jgi:hypothetical protein